MREAAFIEANKHKWVEFENALQQKTQISPDALVDLYLEITDQLGYARTFYPKSPSTAYLNQLAAQAHYLLNRKPSRGKNSWWRFYQKDFPLMFYHHHGTLLLAFLVFFFFVFVGALSAATDVSFVRSILGDTYVNMTLENIAKGDPMAVYKSSGELNMFLGITINNIRVALTAFTMGILFGIGSLYVLMKNGVMLGAFQYFFHNEGVFWESFRTIWIHGTFEISVIIIAGCAGLVVGNSLLFPGTFTRLVSFKNGMIKGSKIMISTLPFFILAGFLEGFVTRRTQMPDFLALLIILSSMALVVFYYLIYPILLNRKINGK